MTELQEFEFTNTYELTAIIDNCVRSEIAFWNYADDFFINSATKFSKDTLLHLYIVTTAMNHYRSEFSKNGDMIDENEISKWYSLFDLYQLRYVQHNFDEGSEVIKWFDNHVKQFELLFDRLSEEVFYVLFSNRQFLLDFNNLTIEIVKETHFPEGLITSKGTIKRVNIPIWVKRAVYHRDKGRCVFCNTDLTGLVNTLTNSNYDHIVPLDLYGTNDPCNMQLSCEKCNKQKTNKSASTGNRYVPWWKR